MAKPLLRKVATGLYVAAGGKVHVAKRSLAYQTPEGWYVEFTNFYGAPQRRRFNRLGEARAFVKGMLGK